MKHLTPSERALKMATRRVVQQVGGVEEAGRHAGRSPARLSHWSNLTNPEVAHDFIPVNLLAQIEPLADDPAVTRELAHLSGYALVPLPAPAPEGVSWLRHLAVLAKEAGDVSAGLAAALADDGKLTVRELADGRLHREVREAIQALIDLEHALRLVDDTS